MLDDRTNAEPSRIRKINGDRLLANFLRLEPARLFLENTHSLSGVQLKIRAGGIHQRHVRTVSGSDRILRATHHKHLFRKLLFDPVATARGSDTIRGDSHI